VPERCVMRYGDLMNSLLSLEATPEDFLGYDEPFLTEVGLYMLPVRIKSKECAALQLWVTDQLLPSFRKKKQPPSTHWHRRR